MINFACSCGKALVAEEKYAGRKVQCPGCGNQVPIPGQPTHFQPPATPQTGPRGSRPPSPYSPQGRHRPQPGYQREDDFPPQKRLDEPTNSTTATISLILGSASFCIPVVLSLPAIILGIAGIMATGEGKRKGRGLALGGLILGFVTLILGGVGGYASYLMYLKAKKTVEVALEKMKSAKKLNQVKAGKRKSENNLKQIAFAMHDHHDAFKHLPSHAIYSPNGKPLLSWRVKLLPYVEESNLYQQFHLNEPWNSPHNIKLLTKMPDVYAHPLAEKGINEKGYTHYQVFVTSEKEDFRSPFVRSPNWKSTLHNMLDGASNTFFIVEATSPVLWTKPEDLSYSKSRRVPGVGLPNPLLKGFHASMGDGSVIFIEKTRMQEKDMRNAITADDGQPVDIP